MKWLLESKGVYISGRMDFWREKFYIYEKWYMKNGWVDYRPNCRGKGEFH